MKGLRGYDCGTALAAVRRGHRAFFAAQRSNGEKFMPAGLAAQRGNSKQSANERRRARNSLRGDPLQFEIAANPAVCIEQRPEWQRPGVKPRFARFAPPGKNADKTEEMVHYRAALGAPSF